MPTIKGLREKLNSNTRYGRPTMFERRDNEVKARFTVDYCKYLENLMPNCRVTIEVRDNSNGVEYRQLFVSYKHHQSAVYLDPGFLLCLLPEVEKIVAKHGIKIKTNYIIENKAA